MNPPNQGTSSSSPADPPLKRKRGRPRKDENVVAQVESTPTLLRSDSTARSKPVESSTSTTTPAVSPDMVGKLVTGVIEGTFDGGYLLKAKFVDSDTHLRGVVFLPGRSMPITATNDVAPQAKMYKRTDMAIPVLNPPAQLPAYVPTVEQSNKQLFQPRTIAPTTQDHKLPPSLQPSIPTVCDDQSPSPIFPLLATAGPSLVGKPMFVQPPGLMLGLGNQSQPATVAPQLGLGKIGERDKLLQELEASIRKGPVVVNVEKPISAPPHLPSLLQALPVAETDEPEVQYQNPGHEFELNELASDGVEGMNVDKNQTAVVIEPVIASPEKQDSAEKATTTLEEIDMVTTASSDQTPDLNGRPANDSATTSQSAPSTGLPVEQCLLQKMNEPQSIISSDAMNMNMTKEESELVVPAVTSFLDTYEKEALAPPLESKVTIDGSVLPRTSEPSFYSPSVPANNSIDCNMNDAIPPAES